MLAQFTFRKHSILFLFCALFVLNELDAVKIGIISNAGYCGEREIGWRIKIAAEKLGWTAILDEQEGRDIYKKKKFDWVICLMPYNRYENRYCPTYVTMFHPFNYLEAGRTLNPFYDKYDGYLVTVQNTIDMENAFLAQNKKLKMLRFYPSIYELPYKKLTLNNLVTMIPVWSNRLTDEKFKHLYYLLSLDGLTSFYGIHPRPEIIAQGYAGSLPFDGRSVPKALQKHGIVLVLHSDIHNAEGIPTGRIFEAASASTVIISDENTFVREHFGDSVFYIDTSLSSVDIYEQIQCHLNTIFSDPEKALEMAKKAHDIFVEKFEMSKLLQQIHELHLSPKE